MMKMAVSESDTSGCRKIAAEAARIKDVTSTEAWDALSNVSSNTEVDTVEIFEDEIVVNGSTFSGPLLWHVVLNYGNDADAFATSDSVPGTFEGLFDDGRALITRMTADTSSFYE
jgi:Predicted pPIWI-associating nuclease